MKGTCLPKCGQGQRQVTPDTPCPTPQALCCVDGGTGPCPRGQKGECIALENPLKNNTTDVTVIIGWVIKAALGVMGSLALLMLVWGGFQWLTSAGNPERVESGTQTMVWAVIGIVVVLSSYLVVTTYIQYLTGAK